MQNTVHSTPTQAQLSPDAKAWPAWPMYVFVLANVEKNASDTTQPGMLRLAM